MADKTDAESSLPPLLDFRTTYLRAIALAWLDNDFKASLLKDARLALSQAFSFKWPWSNLELTVRSESEFEWIGNNWIWPADQEDKLTLSVPLSVVDLAQVLPPNKEREPSFKQAPKHAPALAAYYKARPSLLNGGSPVAASASGTYIVSYTPHFAKHLGYGGISAEPDISGNDSLPNGFLPSSSGFTNFEVALLSAMAAAWDNSNFSKALQRHPIAILHTVRKYSPPWKLSISVKNDDTARYVVPDKTKPHVGKWENLSPHQLELCLPAVPKEGDHAIALAAYNATGAEYPFTCCF